MRTYIIILAACMLAACFNNSDHKKEESSPTPEHNMHQTGMMEAQGYPDSVNIGLITEDTMKGSPLMSAMSTVHGTHVHIEYGSPGVKGRIIWGGLVPYDKVWVTGAHHATRISFYKDVLIDGKKIGKGTYALFTIPGKTDWTIILNKNYDQHLADEYDQQQDVLRVTVKPENHVMMQRLTYAVEELPGDEGVINIVWEKIKLSLSFKTT